MLSLITRIGSIGTLSQHIKRLAIRDKCKSRIEKFKGTWFKKGVGILAMTSIPACGIVGVKNEMTNSKRLIRDLEDVVKTRASYLYKADRKVSIRSFFLKEEPIIELNWDDVLISPEKSKCEEIKNSEDVVVRASSETVLKNGSKIDQQHKLTAERQTSSICETSLHEGFSIGSTVGLYLITPATLENSKGKIEITTVFSLEHKQDNKSEEKDVWSVEDFVIVPRKSTITVSRQLNEKEKEYSFTTRIAVSGNVKATCYNKKGEKPLVYDISMRTIIAEEFEKRMVTEKGDISFITVSGRCKLKQKLDKIIITPTKNP